MTTEDDLLREHYELYVLTGHSSGGHQATRAIERAKAIVEATPRVPLTVDAVSPTFTRQPPPRYVDGYNVDLPATSFLGLVAELRKVQAECAGLRRRLREEREARLDKAEVMLDVVTKRVAAWLEAERSRLDAADEAAASAALAGVLDDLRVEPWWSSQLLEAGL